MSVICPFSFTASRFGFKAYNIVQFKDTAGILQKCMVFEWVIKVFVSKQIRTLEVGFSPGRWWCRKGKAVVLHLCRGAAAAAAEERES